MAIYVQRGASFEATCVGFDTGLVGTIGVRILDNVGGEPLARTTVGISEIVTGSGLYSVTLFAPSTPGEFSVVWDDGSTDIDHTAAESLIVIGSASVQVLPSAEGMTFGEILDDVLGNPNRFESSLRGRAGRAVNNRYAHLWTLEDWSFRYALATVNVLASNSAVVNMPADFGTAMYLWDENGGVKLPYLEIGEFELRYLPAALGAAEAWTVVDGQIRVGPTPDAAASWTLYYRKRFIPLSDEGDMPLIPTAFHLALVHGGRAELLAVSDAPNAGVMEQLWQMDIDAMRREYLADAVGQPDAWPTDIGDLVGYGG